MARLSTTGGNAALGGLVAVIGFLALHVGDPSTTGANENANAGSYARQTCGWNTPASSAVTNSGAMTFSTLGTIAVSHFGGWSSATYGGGNYGIGGALASSVTAASITVAAGALSIGAS